MLNSFILLQQQGEGGGGLSGMLMIVAMVVIFYFFMIRPQNKKQKEIKKAREAMQNGDRVVTAGGIHGKIRDINDTTINIEIAPGVSIKVDKTSVYPAAEPVKSEKK
ncbi:MAG: preprotein translocase subunit YajC [Muribaculaceae bacterium]|nr:preprotein translocase subunit YajC [Muribaculaceae bacterium]MDE6337653.1 preprotein translocase subunit YajC [Muribaculaceae bacterium]MDE6769059.1 preprotein translocase subunit YajC [Muribaculaceae bacterium]MDE6794390.1 preprotein translocase subunit YajC [Muribaculaceae bacterium]